MRERTVKEQLFDMFAGDRPLFEKTWKLADKLISEGKLTRAEDIWSAHDQLNHVCDIVTAQQAAQRIRKRGGSLPITLTDDRTPAPWHCCEYGQSELSDGLPKFYALKHGAKTIANFGAFGVDAILASATPDMEAALCEMIDTVDEIIMDDNEDSTWQQVKRLGMLALKKSRGE